MTPVITRVEMDVHRQEVRELFGEYLSYLHPLFERDFEFTFDVDTKLESDMAELHKFTPPHGLLLLAHTDGQLAGCVGLRSITEDVGEVKRMYVRPQHRRKGIGHALVTALMAEARQLGHTRLRLDSGPFMSEAHALYRSFGFTPTPPYADAEIFESFHARWVFMELSLGKQKVGG